MEHICTICFRLVEKHPMKCECGDNHFPPLCCPGCDCGSFEAAEHRVQADKVGDDTTPEKLPWE